MLAATLPGPAGAASDILPGQRFRTVADGPFRYHFAPRGRPYVEALAPIGRRAFDLLAEWTGNTPDTPIHVVVVPENDYTNGIATPLPRNQIRLFPMQPRQPSSLQEYDNFLELLFVHELIHIFHIDYHRMPATIFRKIFGRNFLQGVDTDAGLVPLFLGFPNGLLPDTLLEGYAVWGESVLAGRGRANTPLNLSLMRNLGRARALPGLGDAIGVRRSYPGGQSPYLFGGRVHLFAATELDLDWARAYRWNATGLFPYLWAIPVGAIEKQGLPREIWKKWKRYEWDMAYRFDRGRSGLNVGVPIAGPYDHLRGLRYGPDGNLYTAIADGTSHDRIVRFSPQLTMTTVGERDGGNGLAVDARGGVWFDQTAYVTDTALVSELRYLYRGQEHRIGVGQHLFEPDVAAGRLVYVRRAGPRYCLEVRALDGDLPAAGPVADAGPRVGGVCGPPHSPIHHPRLDPAGERVAFTMWTAGGRNDLYVWPVTASRPERITRTPEEELWPAWSGDGGSILAVRTLDGAPDLYRYRLADGGWHRLTRTHTGVWQAAATPEMDRVFYTAPGDGGWTIHTAPLAAADGEPVTDATPLAADPRLERPGPPRPLSAAALPAGKPYRAARTLAPTGWVPQISLGAGPDSFGARVGSRDVLWEWSYDLALKVNTDGDPDVDADLSYDQGPWVYGAAGDVFPLTVRGPGAAPLKGRFEVQAARIFRHRDWTTVGATFLAGEDRLRRRTGRTGRAQLGGRLSFDSRERYRWSLVPVDGIFAKLLGAGDGPLAGPGTPDARVEAVAATGGMIWRKLAWQLAGAGGTHADGPLVYRLVPPSGASFAPRTYTSRAVPGVEVPFVDRFALWDAEAVLPWFTEWGLGSLPLYVDNIHGRPFVAGAHWEQRGAQSWSVYAGGEVGIDIVVAWQATVPLRFGYRHPVAGYTGDGGEFYAGTAVNLDQGGRFLAGIFDRRPRHPEREHRPR